MSDEGWFPEPFGPIYERPPGTPCPACECCSQRLCETAAGKDTICQHMSDDPHRVSGCPCTATAQARARTRALEDRQPGLCPCETGVTDWCETHDLMRRPADPEAEEDR